MSQALGYKVGLMNKKTEDEIKSTVERLLNRPIDDERRVLEIIAEAITSKNVSPSLVEQAVKQSVYKYETKMRVFAIAAANRQIPRILRLIDTLDMLEEELGDPSRYASMKDQDLLRLYVATQANLNNSLDYIKKIIDFRMEATQAQAALLTAQEKEQVDATGLPTLDAQQRDRVRKIIKGMAEEIIDIDKAGVSLIAEGEENDNE